MARKKPLVLSTRVNATERAVIDAAARAEGVSVSRLLRMIVIPSAAQRVARFVEHNPEPSRAA